MDYHRVVRIDAEHANLEQVTIASGTEAHHEVVIESPLCDGIANGVKHVHISDAMLPSCLHDPHK